MSPGPHSAAAGRPQPLSLRRNVAWTLVGNVGNAACQVGLLLVLAKLGTPEMVGQFVLGIAVATPIFMLTNLGLRSIQATDSRGEFRFSEYLHLRTWSSLAGMALVGLLGFFSDYEPATVQVILLVGAAKIVEGWSDVLYGRFQQIERMDWIAFSKLAQGLLSVAWLAPAVWLTGDIVVGATAYLFSWLLVLLAYDLRRARDSWGLRPSACSLPDRRPSRDSDETACSRDRSSGTRVWVRLPFFRRWNTVDAVRLGRLAWMGLPVGGTALLSSLNKHVPRYFIAHQLGMYELGIFGALATLMMAGTTVSRALNQAACPRLARLYAAGDIAGFRRLIGKLTLFYLAAGLAGVLMVLFGGRPLIRLLFQPEYAAHYELLLYVMIAAAVTYVASLLDTAMIAVRCLRPLVPLMLLTIAAVAGGCWLLIPRYGLSGAGMALALSKLPLVALGWYLLSGSYLKESVGDRSVDEAAGPAARAA